MIVDLDRRVITARASLGYPVGWSIKSTAHSLVPHLSTVDAAVLSVLLSESYLALALDVRSEQRRAMWLRRLAIKAGTTPQEQLTDVVISARHLQTRIDPVGAVSVLECRLGGLRAQCEVVHEPGRMRSGSSREVVPEDLLGDPALRYYGQGWRQRDHDIRDVRLDPDVGEISAMVRMTTEGGPVAEGLEGNYQPSVSVIDGVVVLAQLAQSLLYTLDEIDRTDSHTLWMRRIDIVATTPHRPIDGPVRTSTSLTRSGLVDYDGSRWRTSDWTADFHGLRYGYRAAHRLPAASVAEGR